ncbi:hypothetical protein SEVIR_5G468800v4 [Setaria viridis]|uniref:Box C/D snoRNA protein 1 n=2 Tax=Setaria viridis TaxID=4556 RepID=A0A4U6UXJ4_SETVI|nr:putative box C/D snoRNA protein SPCC613.07 [Setaria viridis]TKW18989.1 hypothetical protein SEVIR_5G468800v2 [Setaria viridis]
MEDDREEPPPAENASADDSSSSAAAGGKKGSPCEECGEQAWKYRCPGCARLTCSLPCVQAHKRRTACTGKRPRTDPVPLAQFDDNQLISDYNFLEETKQVRESAHRLIGGFGRNFGGQGGAQLPSWLFFLRKAAQRRGIRLYFLPRGMARREQNRSRHNHRKDCIYWTLEWKFNSTDVVLTDHEIDEHTTLLSLLEKHLCPGPWKDQLTQYRNTEFRDLKLFIQKSAKESESPYRLLNIEEPLRPQLRGILVVEYPSIKVFLPSDSYDFEVEKMTNKLAKDGKTTGSTTDEPPVEGNKFHEEEIEEGEFSPETEIIDLKDCGPSSASKLAAAEVTGESRRDNNVDSSVLSYSGSQAVHGQQKELNQYSKMSSNGSSGRTETKSRMEACPLEMEKARESELCSSGHIADLKEHGTSYPGSLAEAGVAALSKIDRKTDSLVPSSINILAPDGATGPQQEQSQQSRQIPSSTPEALKKKSFMKVYPLDFEDNNGGLLLEVPDLAFEQEMMDTYPELFGDMDVDDFLSCDFETMTADESVEAMSGLLWDDLEEGEIPTM